MAADREGDKGTAVRGAARGCGGALGPATAIIRHSPDNLQIHGNRTSMASPGVAVLSAAIRWPDFGGLSRHANVAYWLCVDGPELARVFTAVILAFPGSRHDDQVDSLSQFLNWVGKGQENYFRYEFIDPY